MLFCRQKWAISGKFADDSLDTFLKNLYYLDMRAGQVQYKKERK